MPAVLFDCLPLFVACARENSKGISIEFRRLEPMPMAGVPTKDFVVTLVVEAGI